jgi:hypothetical protein
MVLLSPLLCGQGAVASNPKPSIRRSSVVQIKFVRSGGIAGNMTSVEGSVDLSSANPSVQAVGGKYSRALAPDEAEQLRCAVDASAKCAEEGKALHSPPVPDGTTYDVDITQRDGKVHSLKFQPEKGTAQHVSPELMGWIQDEARKIWDFRLKQRSAASPAPTPNHP